jgi:transposase
MGHDVIVANARKLRFIYAGTCKTDQLDAEALARVGCLQPQLLHPVHHRSRAAQEDLNVLQARDTLIEVRTKLINTIRGLIKASGREPLARVDAAHFVVRHGALLMSMDQEQFTCLVRTLEATQAQIEELDRRLVALADSYPATEILRQVFGVGPITALAFILVIEDPDRFPCTRKVGAYLGLVPRIDQSGEVNPKLGITKAGHPMLRRLLVQCAHRMMRADAPDSSLKRHGLKIRASKDKGASKRAAVAVARKLAVVLLTLWKTGAVYEPLRQAA